MPRPARMCPESPADSTSSPRSSFILTDYEDSESSSSPHYHDHHHHPAAAGLVPLDLRASSSPAGIQPASHYRLVRDRTSSAGSLSDYPHHLPASSSSYPAAAVLPILWWEQPHLMPDSYFDQPPVGKKIMPRVVDNQREKFEGDANFRRLSRESEVRYAGVPIERPIEQRRRQFEADVQNGFLIVSSLTSGTHMVLTFRNPRNVPEAPTTGGHDRDLSVAEIRNHQLYLQSKMILNGVCVLWIGYIDMETLDGLGRLEFDTAAAEAEANRTAQGLAPRQ